MPMTFYGDKGQDEWVATVALPGVRNGYFVDLAAADGIADSNTLALERFFGWKGVCIEPVASHFEVLRANRSAKCVRALVGRDYVVPFLEDGTISGVIGPGYMYDPTHPGVAARLKAYGIWEEHYRPLPAVPHHKIHWVRPHSLVSVLNAVLAPRDIDYMSVDVEGSEDAILLDFPFDRFLVRCMTIERPSRALHERLASFGHVLVKNHANDAFYMHCTSHKDSMGRAEYAEWPEREW